MSSIQPSEYESAKFSVNEPVKADSTFDFSVMKFVYAGGTPGKFNIYFPGDPADPGVKLSKISENPKKPGSLTQGMHVTDDATLRMLKDMETKAFEAVIKHKDHKDMPKIISKYASVEQLKLMFPSVKGFLHYPKKRNAAGQPTDEIDPEADPMFYYSLMRANMDGPKKGEIFSKYYSAQMLSPNIEAAIKRGEKRESDFLFPVVTDPKQPSKVGLFETKTGMKAIPTIIIGDVFISGDKIKVRCSISDGYIREFTSGEPPSRKNVKNILAGITTEAVVMPAAAPAEDQKEEDKTNVINNYVPAAEAAKGFTVEVLGE